MQPSPITYVLIVIPVICAVILAFLLTSEKKLLTEFLSYAVYFLMAGIITPLGILIWQHLTKLGDSKGQDSQILNEYKQKYHAHVKELFNAVIQNLDQPNSIKYFDAIRKIRNEKKLLLEHFCTTTLVHHEYSNLYVWYKTIVTSHNDLEEESKALYSLIKRCESEIEALGFERPPSENWIQIRDFEDAVGIRVPSLQDVLKSIAKPISGYIRYDFPIIYDNSVGEWRIGFERNQFGGSKSQEKINQLSNCIKKYGEEIAKKSSNISGTEILLKRAIEPLFNREFNDLYQTIKHGEPKVGACDSCIEWFGSKEQAKLKNILDNMHKDPAFLEESFWTSTEEKF